MADLNDRILIENPNNYEAKKGEKYELHFTLLSLPLISEIQKNAIIAKINSNGIYKITDVQAQPNELIVTVVIVENPFPLALAIGAITTVLAGFFIWGSLDRVYKIVDSPQGQTLSIGIVLSAVVGIIVVTSLLLRR